jgi:uncharacterized OB-fold protein
MTSMSDDRARKPLPQLNAVTRPFWEAAARGQLTMPRCRDCGAFTWPPLPSCGECGSAALEWTRLSGRGMVYSFTVIRQIVGGPSARAFEPDIPYVVAWIDLEEGPRLVSNIVGCPIEQVTIGMAVEVVLEQASAEIWLPKFKPLAAAAVPG